MEKLFKKLSGILLKTFQNISQDLTKKFCTKPVARSRKGCELLAPLLVLLLPPLLVTLLAQLLGTTISQHFPVTSSGNE